MSITTGSSAAGDAGVRSAGKQAMSDMQAVGRAAADIDNVNVFTKFIKKAEEAAQSAL